MMLIKRMVAIAWLILLFTRSLEKRSKKAGLDSNHLLISSKPSKYPNIKVRDNRVPILSIDREIAKVIKINSHTRNNVLTKTLMKSIRDKLTNKRMIKYARMVEVNMRWISKSTFLK